MNKLLLFTIYIFFGFTIHAQTLYTDADISAKTINTSLAVGLIPGAASVSENGHSGYSIPVLLPAGVKNMTPEISINYSSATGASLLGYGWTMNAYSSIGYDNKNLYNDNEQAPAYINSSGPYYWNGQRLFSVNGTNTEFKTEQESYAKITASSGANPASFTVITKSGITMEYGTANDAKVVTSTSKPVKWLLKKVADNLGNYITYTYQQINNEVVLSNITYTQNSQIAAQYNNSVDFEYTTRIDNSIYFAAEESVSDLEPLYRKNKLTSITIKSEGQLVSKYEFIYGDNGLYTFLKEVKLNGYESGVASPLNSTIFKYGSTATANSTQNFTASVVAGKKAETLTGDFNGDGLDDLFVAYYTITGQYPRKYTDYKVYLRNSAGTDFLTTPSATGTFPATAYWDGGNSGTVCSLYVELFVTDIDGNGRADITITKRGRMFYNGYARLLGAYTLSGNNSATSFTLQDFSSQMSVFGDINSGNYFITGDFDGDHRTDWMTMSGADNDVYIHFPAKNSFNILLSNYVAGTTYENCFGSNIYHSNNIKIEDFNADGKDDVLITSNEGAYACQNSYSRDAVYSIYYDALSQSYDIIRIAENKLVNGVSTNEFSTLNDYTGDFNGDGKVDVFTPNYNGTFKIKYSSGRRQSADYNFPFNESVSLQDVNGHREFFSIGDFNGDGKSDIAHQYLSGTNTHNVSVYYSNGSGFQQVLSTFNYDTLYRPYKVADFNGDGIDDLVDTLKGNTGQLYITYLKPKNQDYLLTKIKDGYERVTEFQYKLFTESSGIYTYTAPTGNIYPLQINVPRTNGVYKMIMPDGSGNVTNTTYTQYAYANAVSHIAGKGFLGFKTHKSTDNLTTLTTEITNDVINNNTNFYLFGGINAKTYYLATPANLLSQSVPTYEITDLGNKRFVINTTQHKNTNYITDIENTEGLTQDGDGNITQSVNTIKTASSQTVNQSTTTIITGFSLSPPSVIPSLPQVVNTTNSYGGSSYSVETKNEYTNGLLTKVTLFNNLLSANPSPSVISLIEYDAVGNVLKTTITPSNASGSVASRYTRYEYQPNFKTIYKTYSSGVSGEILTSEVLAYDPRFGVPSTIKNGIYTNYITTNVFDAFGRLKSGTLAPNNITTNTQWQWDNSVSNGIVKTVSTTTGAPLSIVYADRLGRTIKTSTENFSGALISSSTTYDNMGRVLTTIAPDGSNAGTNMTTNYSYLPITGHYRLNTVSSSLGTVNYSYTTAAGLNSVKTTYPGSRISEVFTDASGKTVKTTDNAGTVYTTYNAQGMPLQINAADATTTMEYDAATGRQTKLIEPNSGTTEYKFNGYGELIYTKDNKGFEWEMQYDALGRTTQKNRKAYSNKPNTYPATDADQLTQYFYETATNGKEQLKLKKINGTTVEEYIYDAWHRNTAITQTIDASTILTTAFEYNTDNSIKSVTYPENVKFNYNYTALGYLQSVKNGDNTITLYQTNTTNAYNTPLQYTLGNGKTTNITLLANGQMSNTQTLLSGTTYIQKLNYTIPDITTGNITQRKDETKAANTATDVFAYETQYDRLSSITTNGNAARTWTYDNDKNGNVKSSTDLGNFSYHAVKKHALTQTQLSCTQTGTQVPIQTLDYTPANQPARIIKPGTPNSYEMLFSYGADDTRVKSELKLNGNTQSTRYYSGNYEKWISAGNTKHIYYIYGSTGLCAIATKDNGSSSLNYYYAYTDHLGSLLKLTDNTGNTVVEQSFDAWGRYRDPNNWASYTATAPSGSFAWLRKGFTAHEHLPEFGLILMAQNNNGGRLYDPLTGRMLSPDPFVQNPANTQAYNRYSYALNNPLKYTDPTGYLNDIQPETFDPNDDYNGRGGTGGSTGGGEMGSYNYSGPYSLYVRNPTLYGYIYGTSSAYWVVSSHSTLVTDPYIGKNYVTDTKKSYNLTTYHVFNASSRGSTSSDRYDYWTDNGDWGMLLAGGGNMANYAPLGKSISGVWKKAGAAVGVLVADDATGVGVADDVAVPVVLAGATVATYEMAKIYVTYTLTNEKTGQVYVGRTSGLLPPELLVKIRYWTHHMRLFGYGNPQMDVAARGLLGKFAIRGREQQLIDFYGGVGSPNVGNSIRGVSKINPAGFQYWNLSNQYFGNIAPFTGFQIKF